MKIPTRGAGPDSGKDSSLLVLKCMLGTETDTQLPGGRAGTWRFKNWAHLPALVASAPCPPGSYSTSISAQAGSAGRLPGKKAALTSGKVTQSPGVMGETAFGKVATTGDF